MRHRTFVISGGRSGSTALAAHARATDQDVNVRHEPPFWLLMKRMSIRLAADKSSLEDAARLLRRLRPLETRRTSGRYIETTPALWGFTPILPQVFPSCTLVHIVRHPFDYIASTVRFKLHAAWKDQVYIAIPDLYPDPQDFGMDFTVASLSAAERAAWSWCVANSYVADICEPLTPTLYRFHFDTVFGQELIPARAYDLAHLLGIKHPGDFVSRLQSHRINASSPQPANYSRASVEQMLRPNLRAQLYPIARHLGFEL